MEEGDHSQACRKKVGLGFLKGRLARLWNPPGDTEVIDLNHDYFVIRFSNVVDYNHVFDGSPWFILGHYISCHPTMETKVQACKRRATEGSCLGVHP